MLAKASGADVAIIDTVAHSLDVARNLGAAMTIQSDRIDPVAGVEAFTGERGADIVFEYAGGASMPETLPLATRLVRCDGKVVIIGGFDAGATSIALE